MTVKNGKALNREKVFSLLCQQSGLPTPVFEYKFHPQRKWRADVYFENAGIKVALEVEGGVWTGGRHTRASGFIGDIEKYNALAVAGIFLIRVTPADFLTLKTIETLKEIFKPRTP